MKKTDIAGQFFESELNWFFKNKKLISICNTGYKQRMSAKVDKLPWKVNVDQSFQRYTTDFLLKIGSLKIHC